LLFVSEAEGPRGTVLGIDLQHMAAIEGATLLHQSDFTKPETQALIRKLLDGAEADAVISDMAPNPTGVRDIDRLVILELCKSALKFAAAVLKLDGCFLCKMWEGNERQELEKLMRMVFKQVKVVKPLASRTDSAELFLLGKYFKGLPKSNR
jgi:23S rRNA (uridine2552-2'-O)-methyltransferase